MLVKLPKEVRKIMTELQNAGFEVYIEGECIRESVMGRSPYGWDLITDAGIDQMKELFPEAMVLSEKYQILRFEYIEEMPGKDRRKRHYNRSGQIQDNDACRRGAGPHRSGGDGN